MLVRPKTRDSLRLLSKEARKDIGQVSSDPLALLRPGRVYVVYAVCNWSDNRTILYAICDDSYDSNRFPLMHPASAFEIVDNELSSYWRLNHVVVPNVRQEELLIAFSEWVSDPLFYGRLIEGDPEAISIFGAHKQQMDIEATASLSEEDRLSVLFSGWESDRLVVAITGLYPSAARIVKDNQSTYGFEPSPYVFMIRLLDSIWDGLARRDGEAYSEARSLLDYLAGRVTFKNDEAADLILRAMVSSLPRAGRSIAGLSGFWDASLIERLELLVDA